MERLSDDRIAEMIGESRGPDSISHAERHAMATELQQLRAAKAADRERVVCMLREVLADAEGTPFESTVDYIDFVASRVADALAVPVRVGLSEEERCHLLSVRSSLKGWASLWSAELATLDV